MEQTQSPAGLLCPHCRVDLVMSERQRVEIDYCPKCRGIWLDRGELDTIIERAMSETRTAAPVSFLPPGVAQTGWPQQPAHDGTNFEPTYGSRRDDHHDGHHRQHDDHDERGHRREGFFGRLFD